MERADVIRVVIGDTPFEEGGDHIRITVNKRTVVMRVIPDSEGNLTGRR
jgi:hypothetical protein